MFIYNLKINGNKLFKSFIFMMAIIVCLLFIFICYNIFHESMIQKNNYELPNQSIVNITTNNYTNILKAVHEDLDTYVGQKIHFSGYIYRAIDFSDEEFVLARDMIVSSNSETLIVGFLCKYNKAKTFVDNTWVEITGTIKKGTYHTQVPIIEVSNIKQIEKPSNEFVYPPDDTYIPTSNL